LDFGKKTNRRYKWKVLAEKVGGVTLGTFLRENYPGVVFSISKRTLSRGAKIRRKPDLFVVSADKHRPDDSFSFQPTTSGDLSTHVATTFYKCSNPTSACINACGGKRAEDGKKCECGVQLACSCKESRKKDCSCTLDLKHGLCQFQLKVECL
jgi:hypothetical protein